jgi:WhiB family redox-sensing transcriptional regulator
VKTTGRDRLIVEEPSDLDGLLEASGLCVNDDDPGAWFAERKEVARREHAKLVCLECPVKNECLELALACRIEHGVWGATTPNDRRRLVRA